MHQVRLRLAGHRNFTHFQPSFCHLPFSYPSSRCYNSCKLDSSLEISIVHRRSGNNAISSVLNSLDSGTDILSASKRVPLVILDQAILADELVILRAKEFQTLLWMYLACLKDHLAFNWYLSLVWVSRGYRIHHNLHLINSFSSLHYLFSVLVLLWHLTLLLLVSLDFIIFLISLILILIEVGIFLLAIVFFIFKLVLIYLLWIAI